MKRWPVNGFDKHVSLLAPNYGKKVRSLFEKQILPVFGAKHIAEVEPADILKAARHIEENGAVENRAASFVVLRIKFRRFLDVKNAIHVAGTCPFLPKVAECCQKSRAVTGCCQLLPNRQIAILRQHQATFGSGKSGPDMGSIILPAQPCGLLIRLTAQRLELRS